jgi:hypothetical protein
MRRPFNEKAYNDFDMKCKQELLRLMSKKGYSIVGDIKEEHYKEYDIKFEKNGKTVSFENETRPNFVRIRDSFNTIHIPTRKMNTQADFYVVWKPEFDEFFLIDRDTISECINNEIKISCIEYEEDVIYVDNFIDIPKNKAKLFKKTQNGWRMAERE